MGWERIEHKGTQILITPPWQIAQCLGPCPPRQRYPSWSAKNPVCLCVSPPTDVVLVGFVRQLVLQVRSVRQPLSHSSSARVSWGLMPGSVTRRAGWWGVRFNLNLRPQRWSMTRLTKNNPCSRGRAGVSVKVLRPQRGKVCGLKLPFSMNNRHISWTTQVDLKF